VKNIRYVDLLSIVHVLNIANKSRVPCKDNEKL